jgi:hypothetical protein
MASHVIEAHLLGRNNVTLVTLPVHRTCFDQRAMVFLEKFKEGALFSREQKHF